MVKRRFNFEDFARRESEIVFKTEEAIYFREPEDLIAYVLRYIRRHGGIIVQHPVWRYNCLEWSGRRYWYEIIVKDKIDGKKTSLITDNATDYSGHGRYDKELMETFIREYLQVPFEDRPATYLLDRIVNLVAGIKGSEVGKKVQSNISA